MREGKILILQRIVPHYREGFFRKFRQKFPGAKIIYGQPSPSESLSNLKNPDKSVFETCGNLYLNNSGSVFISGILPKIFKYKPETVISVFNVGNLNIYLLFLLRPFFNFKIILWSFGYDPVRGFDPSNSFTDKIRLKLSQKADSVIFYWDKGKDEVSKFSEKKDHYFTAPNTLDTDRLFELKKKFDQKGKDILKSELGIKEKYHFIYTGRLLKDKEADLLIKAFSIIDKKRNDCRLTIIGDGPEKEYLMKLSSEYGIKNITFMNEILDDEITGKWIYASDVFVMPGRLGLSVVHSFSFGTPVISQFKEGYFHGEGIGYIKDGDNGILVKEGNEQDLSDKMEYIISSDEVVFKFKANAFETAVSNCSVGNMIKGFEDAVNFANLKKRS
ncbi:MAG TPA: glycosyltransferase [Ignavibacteria bacterium]|nr:glycosyltransferase [Ignavibacteria bacterium]